MKKLLMMLCLYCNACYAIHQDDIPNVYIDRQGNVMNYANLYRNASGHINIRYYIDSSINRLVVEDRQQHSYAIDDLLRRSVPNGLRRWARAARDQISVEEVGTPDRANLLVYGIRDAWPDLGPAQAMGVPPGMPTPGPGEWDTHAGRLYFFEPGLQENFNIFLDSTQPVSQEFRTYTGVNDPQGYLSYQLPLSALHEVGHALGLAHPEGPSDVGGGYTQRPITDWLPSPIVPGAQIMLSTIDYLRARYRELGHAVDESEIGLSVQENWLMSFLWTQRNRNLEPV